MAKQQHANVLTDQGVRRLNELYRIVHSLELANRRNQRRGRQRNVSAPKKIRIINDSGETIPAYGIMAVTTGFQVQIGTPLVHVTKPSTTFRRRYLINGATSVSASGESFAQMPQGDGLYKILYDSGTPAQGDGWGPKPAQWSLSLNFPSTTTVEGIYNAGDTLLLGSLHKINIVIGKLAGSLSQGSTATVNIWAGAGGSEAVVSSLTLTGRDWLMKSGATAIASGKKVICQWINGIWYITEAECA
jgi:hypothetical protein